MKKASEKNWTKTELTKMNTHRVYLEGNLLKFFFLDSKRKGKDLIVREK